MKQARKAEVRKYDMEVGRCRALRIRSAFIIAVPVVH
jgi:hypothetical protein